MHGPTHKSGHILDLVITRSANNIVYQITTANPHISDHLAVLFDLILCKPLPIIKTIKYRSLSRVDTDSLCQDIINSDLYLTTADSLSDHIAQYISILAALLDSNAPTKSKTITERTDIKRYTSELGRMKREVRRLAMERKSNAWT